MKSIKYNFPEIKDSFFILKKIGFTFYIFVYFTYTSRSGH